MVDNVGLIDGEHVVPRDVSGKASRQFGKVEGVQVAGDHLGRRIKGRGFLVDGGMAGGARGDVQVDLVHSTTELDGDPGGSRLGGRHG